MEPKVVVLSPSQIKQWLPSAQGCNRKWGWRYLAHVKEPEKKGTATGTRGHSQIERYLKGEPFDYATPAMREAAEIVIPGMVNLPPPLSPGMLVEQPFRFETTDGIIYRGVMDVEVPDSKVVPGCDGGMPGIIDHKTTKAARYVKTPAELEVDEQSNIYAYAMMAKYKSPVVDVVYNYLFTEGARRTQRVHLRMHSERVVQEFKRIQAVGREISTTYALNPKPLDLTPNLAACDAFGGCPYKLLCTDLHSGPLGHLTPEESAHTADMFPQPKDPTTMTQSGANLFANLETLNAKEAAASPAPMPAGITNAPEGYVPAMFLTAPAAPAASMFPPAMPAVAINPPEYQPPPTPEERAAAATEAPPAAPAKRKRRTKAEMAADAAQPLAAGADAAGEADVYTTAPATIPAPPPDDAQKRIQELTEQRDEEISLVRILGADVLNAREKLREVTPVGFTLYLDCAPENRTITHASELYARVNSAIKEELGAADYRLIKYEGAGRFVAGFCKVFDEGDFGDIVLDTRTAEGLLVLESLRARAGTVVR